MHAFLFCLVISAAALNTASVKALLIAGAIYPILQVIKKLFPGLSGHYALAVNIALAIVGYVVTVPAPELLTVSTLLGVLTAVSAAAGLHGTIQNVLMPLLSQQPAAAASTAAAAPVASPAPPAKTSGQVNG